ncbi:MAG: hypothetical protein KY452_05570 [Actinobacteria bacterium]|nr:hypothetical protein [Actinomycetota bacterium]
MEVVVSAALAGEIAASFGPQRSAQGAPSELDFWSGPLQAALLGFRGFESLPYDDAPQVRRLQVVDRAELYLDVAEALVATEGRALES